MRQDRGNKTQLPFKESTMELDYKRSQQYYYERCLLLEEENTALYRIASPLPIDQKTLPLIILQKWEDFNKKWEDVA